MNDAEYIAQAYENHCTGLHNADFEVCENKTCQIAARLESLRNTLKEARRQMVEHGNRDNWETITPEYSAAVNSISNQYGTGILDEAMA